MRLTRSEFLERFKKKSLRIAFVGPSGTGKSVQTQNLRNGFDFFVHSADEMIWQLLGYDNMEALAEWMGYPFEEGYALKQRIYLALEAEVVRMAYPSSETESNLETEYSGELNSYFQTLGRELVIPKLTIPEGQNFILDTTGSVVHLDSQTHKDLSKHFYVIAFSPNDEHIKTVEKRFKEFPRPIVWENCYKRSPNQDPWEALIASFSELLRYRQPIYEELADVIIPCEVTASTAITPDRMWEIISQAVPRE